MKLRTNERYIKLCAGIVYVISVGMCLFHLYTGGFGVLTAFKQRMIHVTLIGVIAMLMPVVNKKTENGQKKGPGIIDWLLSAGMIASLIYFMSIYTEFTQRNGKFTTTDMIMGGIMVVAVIYITKKSIGWPIVIITLIALVYAYWGHLLPGKIGHKPFTIARIVTHLSLGMEGYMGVPVGAAATFVILFVIMAALLEVSGAGDFFIRSALAVTGGLRGGPAKAAVVSSGLFGTISGSSVANVVSTGNFTIPLMKKSEFEPHVAGAVEAVASTGGQIMPPIMGAAAFVMSEVTGIPYLKIMVAAIIPAILYYGSLYFAIDKYAARRGLAGRPKAELPSLKEEMKHRGHMVLPLVVLIALLVSGRSALRSGFWGTVAVFVCCMVKKDTRMDLKKLGDAFVFAAKGAISCTVACSCAGIIMGVFSLTGLGLKFSALILAYSQGIKVLALLLTMIAGLILGMGMPTTAAYIMLSTLVAPALTDMGLSIIQAHLFVFYFGILSSITPPVAVASFAAAGIAKSKIGKTSLAAIRFGLTAFIVPFMFAYGPELLMVGSVWNILLALVSSVIGIFFLASATEGWILKGRANIVERVLLLAAALFMLFPGVVTDLIGLGIAALACIRLFKVTLDSKKIVQA